MQAEELRAAVARAVAEAVAAGALPVVARGGPRGGVPLRPGSDGTTCDDADWVSPVALRWAPSLRMAPHALAACLAERVAGRAGVAAAWSTPVGLLALTLTEASRARVVRLVLDAPDSYAAGPHGYAPVPGEPAGSRRGEDPLIPAQLAHARLCRLVRNAHAAGVQRPGDPRLEALTEVAERRLLVALADQPDRLDRHAGDRAQLVRAVADVARRADGWTAPLRPARREEPVLAIHGARLALAEATRIVLRNGLAGLGAGAPERM